MAMILGAPVLSRAPGGAFGSVIAPQPAQAALRPKPAKNSIRLIPTIQSIARDPVTGQLLASGVATAAINRQTVTAPFTAPVGISLAADQSAAQAGCPILDLALGPIDPNLLVLEVILDDCDGGPVVVDMTGQENQLLGDLLCGLLGGGGIDLGTALQGILQRLLGLLG